MAKTKESKSSFFEFPRSRSQLRFFFDLLYDALHHKDRCHCQKERDENITQLYGNPRIGLELGSTSAVGYMVGLDFRQRENVTVYVKIELLTMVCKYCISYL